MKSGMQTPEEKTKKKSIKKMNMTCAFPKSSSNTKEKSNTKTKKKSIKRINMASAFPTSNIVKCKRRYLHKKGDKRNRKVTKLMNDMSPSLAGTKKSVRNNNDLSQLLVGSILNALTMLQNALFTLTYHETWSEKATQTFAQEKKSNV